MTPQYVLLSTELTVNHSFCRKGSIDSNVVSDLVVGEKETRQKPAGGSQVRRHVEEREWERTRWGRRSRWWERPASAQKSHEKSCTQWNRFEPFLSLFAFFFFWPLGGVESAHVLAPSMYAINFRLLILKPTTDRLRNNSNCNYPMLSHKPLLSHSLLFALRLAVALTTHNA